MVFSFLFCIFATKIVLNKQNMKQFSIEEYLKNPSRKVVTRSGDAVKIHCTDFDDDEYPIVARVEGTSVSTPFTKDGKYIKFNRDSKYDLFFAPEKHEGWINLHKNGQTRVFPSYIYQTKKDAEKYGVGKDSYLTTVKIEWEE